jgi:CheY-like chemotaxis protein
MRVLVIDDDPGLRRTLARLLERAGHIVLLAGDGSQGLRLWRDEGAELVITDVRMPGMNGLEVMLQLHQCAPELPIIAISGGDPSRDWESLEDAKLLGAVELLSKPFTGADLRSAVHRATHRRHDDKRGTASA